MKLIWTQTGDCLTIIPEHHSMVEHWLHQLDQSDLHEFALLTPVPRYMISELIECVTAVNAALSRANMTLLPPDLDWLDQRNLNLLHSTYVKMQRDKNITAFLRKIGQQDLVNQHHQVNNIIHETESMVEYLYQAKNPNHSDPWQVPNPYGTSVLGWGVWQVEMEYQSLGRGTYEKWLNWDDNLVDTDTDDFESLGPRVLFRICRPYRTDPPQDYIRACLSTGAPIVGGTLPIGNFQDDIGRVRRLFHDNAVRADNKIIFEL